MNGVQRGRQTRPTEQERRELYRGFEEDAVRLMIDAGQSVARRAEIENVIVPVLRRESIPKGQTNRKRAA